jgi:hypothetical protein
MSSRAARQSTNSFAIVERVVSIRKAPGGRGQQYEIKWQGEEATTWEAASRISRQIPHLVQAFEQLQQQQQQQQADTPMEEVDGDADADAAADAKDEGTEGRHRDAQDAALPAALQQQPANLAADGSSMHAQLEAMQQLLREQAQQLQQLRTSPPQPSPQLSQPPRDAPIAAVAAAASVSRFARKEPRAQDLREYDGAAGVKLDEWLDELGAAVDLFQLNDREAVDFGVSRLRGPARQWWNALDEAAKVGVRGRTSALAVALRSRFQPVTAARTAREQLDKLQHDNRGVNNYISEFQRLHTLLPNMAEEDALYAFERGLRRDLAEKLRIQGVTTVQDAIAMAARVGGLMQSASAPIASTGRAAANQMEIDDNDGASLDDRIQRAVLNAMQTQNIGAATGFGAKTQTQREYNSNRGGVNAAARGGYRGGRLGGRFGNRGGMTYTIPGVPAATVEQRRAAGQCLRCGSADHRGMECPNVPSATQPLN